MAAQDTLLQAIETAVREQTLELRLADSTVTASQTPFKYLQASIKRPADSNAYTANDALATRPRRRSWAAFGSSSPPPGTQAQELQPPL